MARLWVQLWRAQVPGAVQVEESDLVEVKGLESALVMVPMVGVLEDSPLVRLEEKVEVLESENLRELARESRKVLESARQKVTALEEELQSAKAKVQALEWEWEKEQVKAHSRVENCYRWINWKK